MKGAFRPHLSMRCHGGDVGGRPGSAPVGVRPTARAARSGRVMRFRVLGPLEVETDDGPVVVAGRRPRALLVVLLLQPGAVVSTDRLMDALWGADLPASPPNALQQVVARLRARLGGWADCVHTGPGGYLLAAADDAVDAD